jgi:hypothetical protein
VNAKLNIFVASSIASVPNQGGWTWAVLQYLLGLRRLGHDVFFLDLVDPKLLESEGEWSPGAVYFRDVMAEFDFRRRSAMLLKGKQQAIGASYAELETLARKSDLLINLSAVLRKDEPLFLRFRRRLYLDLDPGFTQMWQAVQNIDMHFAGHTHHATIGLSIGDPRCAVPTCGINWITTPQPIVLDHWPLADAIEYDALTTVANWRGYGSIDHAGVLYGQKAHSLRPMIDLPTRTKEKFLLALAIHENEAKDLELLRANEWQLLDPAKVASTPKRFAGFVRGSKAEFGLAKSGYVHADCGWLSDRSLCYLAAGRPVLAQETGFSRHVPTGEGLLSFSTTGDALAAIDSLNSNYPAHQRAARALAESHFDSDKVLTSLLAKVV